MSSISHPSLISSSKNKSLARYITCKRKIHIPANHQPMSQSNTFTNISNPTHYSSNTLFASENASIHRLVTY